MLRPQSTPTGGESRPTHGSGTGKSTATIAAMTAVFTNILEAAQIGKRRHLHGFLIALAASLVAHCIILIQTAGSARMQGPPEVATARAVQKIFAYVNLASPANSPVSPSTSIVSPTLVFAPREQKTASGDAIFIPIATPDEHYLRAKALDTRPTPVGSLAFKPPKLGVGAKPIEVRLRIFVNEYGAVDFVRIEGEAPDSEFTEPIIATLKKSRFSPGQVNGENVKSQLVLGWKFETESND